MSRTVLLVAAVAALACDSAASTPAGTDHAGDRSAPAAQPSGGAPIAPLACADEPDLPPAQLAPGACGAPLDLGPGVELSTRHAFGQETRCDELAIDGGGTVAARALRAYAVGYWATELQFLDAAGGSILRAPFDRTHVALVATERGFLGFRDPGEIAAYAHDGSTAGEAEIPWGMHLAARSRPWGYSGYAGSWPDPAGGLLVAMVGASEHGEIELRVAAVDARGQLAAGPLVVASRPPPPPTWWDEDVDVMRAFGNVAFGRDGAGRLLVAWDGRAACGPGTFAARWFSPAGAPLGGAFVAARGVTAASPRWGVEDAALVRLHDGSLALASGGVWIRRFAGGAPAGGPPPEWLARRAGERVVSTPREGLLAAVRPATASEPRGRIDLVASGGDVCTSLEFPTAGDPASAGAAATLPTVGLDGTTTAWVGTIEDASGARTCLFRAWPQALR